jgi:hypothetical protein
VIEVVLDASQIETFETCPYKWYLDHYCNLESCRTNPALSTGSFYHEVLKFHYQQALTTSKPPSEGIRRSLDFAQYLITCTELTPELLTHEVRSLPPKEVRENSKFHLDRLRDYFAKYVCEDDSSEIIAVEKGFSYILYEDNIFRFILEGMIDLISIEKSTKLTVTDHKTQSRFYEKYGYNHQALNYLNFTKANYFRYNYIGLQENNGPNTFRRPIFRSSEGMLEQWQKDIMQTFLQMATYSSEGEDFPRHRTSCQTKYGICQFHRRCEIPDDSKWVTTIMTAYKEKERKWKAWS